MTKADILSELELLPLSRLEKLHRYADKIMIPDDDLLVKATMTQMVDKAMQLADEHFPEWTDRSETDFGKFLVELFAVFSEKDFHYINGFANHSFLSKMSIYSNIFTKAIEYGYSPTLCNSAEASFEVIFDAGSAFTYPKGSLIIEFQNEGFKFTNIEPFTVPASSSALTLPLVLREGELFSDSQAFNGYRLPIRRKLISVEDLEVVKDNIEWDRVRVFGQSGSSSKHYMVLPEEDGSVNIYFGEDGYGARPDLNSDIRYSFLVCNGSAPNDVTDDLRINKYSPSRKANSVTMTSLPEKGKDPEAPESIINNTLNYFSTKFTVNNDTAVERWLASQPEVKRSKALIQGNVVYFRVQPKDGSVASPALLTALEDRIRPFVSGGYDPQGLPTTYINPGVFDIEMYYLSGYSESNLISILKSFVVDYTDPLVLNNYGNGIDLSELSFLLKSRIKGLQNIVFNTPNADIPINDYELLEKISTSDITVIAHEV